MQARFDPESKMLFIRANLANAIARRASGTASINLDVRQTLGYIERRGKVWRLDIESIQLRAVPVDGEMGGDERSTYLFQI